MTNKRFTQLKTTWFFSIIIILLLSSTACSAQAPEASKARSRAVINAGEIVPAAEIRVAEYLRYYEQHFPEPEQDTLGLDVRLGNSRLPAQGGQAWLQIGLQAKSEASELVAPLNLALVIDGSGSMDAPDKMPYLKQSLHVFLQGLNPDDIVSLIVYSDEAELLLPAQPVGDGHWVQAVIDRIQPDGSTNLHAGMMMGLNEVDKNFDIRRNNRVILLTDGIANQGITGPTQIAADALDYNQRGIYLSTIGLGLEFNDALLSQLAQQGQGGYSFVDSAQEMDRVFREHVAGLKQRAASKVNLTIEPEAGVQLVGLTGLEDSLPAEGVNIPLPPLGTGDSTVLLVRLQVEPSTGRAGSQPLARVELSYFDEFARRPVTIEQIVTAELVPNLTGYDPTWDLEILRNVTIQQMAEGMREIDRLFQAGQYEAAWHLAVELENKLNDVVRLTHDNQLLADVELMQRYQQTLAEAVWQTEGRRPRLVDDSSTGPSEARPYRGDQGGPPTPTPSLPTVEIR